MGLVSFPIKGWNMELVVRTELTEKELKTLLFWATCAEDNITIDISLREKLQKALDLLQKKM